MKKTALLLCLVLSLAVLAGPVAASSAGPGISTDEAARILKEGNGRYVDGKPRHPHQDRERRALTAGQGQHPLATVLTCSDSRVPPEIIFDQGIGDIFVVRVAGNVAATDEIGSIEYAVDHLATPLVMVLGHTQCGAVTAVVDDDKLPPNIAALVEPIRPAVAKAREDHPEAAKDVLLNAAIKDNVWQAITDMLGASPIIRDKVKGGQVRVVGAIYEIDSGQVLWLGPHPEQDKLLGAKKGAAGKTGRKGKKAKRSEE
ncbi:MAG: carbonic anhydrase [Desulfobaccales bacterium]